MSTYRRNNNNNYKNDNNDNNDNNNYNNYKDDNKYNNYKDNNNNNYINSDCKKNDSENNNYSDYNNNDRAVTRGQEGHYRVSASFSASGPMRNRGSGGKNRNRRAVPYRMPEKRIYEQDRNRRHFVEENIKTCIRKNCNNTTLETTCISCL
jgi:hypothetical protein